MFCLYGLALLDKCERMNRNDVSKENCDVSNTVELIKGERLFSMCV